MFKLANGLNNFFAGISGSVGAAVDNLPDPVTPGITQLLGEGWLADFAWALAGAISRFFYIVIRYVLNIVDFLQYFVKHLIGLDYWEKGNINIETVGESDIIFRFLYDPGVQRVFKYMMGIFAVLLILFAIIALIRNQYLFAVEAKDSDNNPMRVIKASLKSIFLVVIIPVLLICGILASNAVLAGLVNALNVNNRLTLGGQVFVSSAYDANRYRKYAETGLRYPVAYDTLVEIPGKSGATATKRVKTTITPIKPNDYTKNNKFTGFAFEFREKQYLYYVPEEELRSKTSDNGVEVESAAYFYVTYIENILGAKLLDPVHDMKTSRMSLTIHPSIISCNLSGEEQSSKMIQAAYNTWSYNSVMLPRQSLKFDKTITGTKDTVSVDSGHSWYATRYTNNKDWSEKYDGGQNGIVQLPHEYAAMGDVIDFCVSDVCEFAIVNFNNPLIMWNYASGMGGYLSSQFVISDNNNGELKPKEFVVQYKDEFVHYVPNLKSERETDGAIYIVAYYSPARNAYIPMVNGATYIDDNGVEHYFKSDIYASTYKGLVVARGILEGGYGHNLGVPTEIISDFKSGGIQGVGSQDPYYYMTSMEKLGLFANVQTNIVGGTYGTKYLGNDIIKTDNYKTIVCEIPLIDMNYTNSVVNKSVMLGAIANSLATSFDYSYVVPKVKVTPGATSGDETTYEVLGQDIVNSSVSDIKWRASGDSTIHINGLGDEEFYVFVADKTVRSTIQNRAFLTQTNAADKFLDNAKTYDLPLYALVGISRSGDVKVYYLYSQYALAGADFFSKNLYDGISLDQTEFDNALVSSYNIQNASSTLRGKGVVARILNVDSSYSFIDIKTATEPGDNAETYVDYGSGHTIYIKDASFKYYLAKETLDVNDNHAQEVIDYLSKGRVISYQSVEHPTNLPSVINGSVIKLYPELSGENFKLNVLGSDFTNSPDYFNDSYFTEVTDGRIEDENSITYNYVLQKDNKILQASYMATYMPLEGYGSSVQQVQSLTNIIVKVFYNKLDHSFTYYFCNPISLRFSRQAQGNTIYSELMNFDISIYGMEFVRSKTIDEGSGVETVYTYRYSYNNQYYYIDFTRRINEVGQVSFTSKVTPMYRFETNYFNFLTYGYKTANGTVYKQINPNESGEDADTNPVVVSTSVAYTTTDAVTLKYITTNLEGEAIYEGTIYYNDAQNNIGTSGTRYAVFRYTKPLEKDDYGQVIPADLELAWRDSFRLERGMSSFGRIPVYESKEEAGVLRKSIDRTIEFKRDVIGKIFGMIDLNLNFFGIGGPFRLHIALGLYDQAKNRTSSFVINNSRVKLDYNFKDSNITSLGMDIFYVPELLNFVVLIFASIILMNVLGQAVWGLIQRIFDITLYFIILPGVASTYPFDDGSRFKTWKDNLIKKVFGAYGVMLGLNLFFILCPAIRNVSHLFTADDLGQLSSGNFLSGVSVGWINNVCELLFMLVAISMIKTMPGLISSLLQVDDYYAQGAKTKSAVQGAAKEVGETMSGKKVVEAAKDAPKMLKNFVPGGAVIDEIKGRLKKKPKPSSQEVAKNLAQQNVQSSASNSMQSAQKIMDGNKPAENKNSNEAAKAAAQSAAQTAAQTAEQEAKNSQQATDSQEASKDKNVNVVVPQKEQSDSEKNAAAENAADIVNQEMETNGNDSAKVGYADVAGRVEDTSMFDDVVQKASNYAQAAQKFAEASGGFANVATGNVGGKLDKRWHSRDEHKLEKLERKRQQRLADQENGEGSMLGGMTVGNRKKAYEQYNNGVTDAKEKIFDKNTSYETEREKAFELYNKKHFKRKMDKDKFFEEYGNVGSKIYSEAKELVETDQNIKKAVARNQFVDKRIDDKIAKQNDIMRQKQEGVYESGFKKAMLWVPRQFSRKMTDADKQNLEGKMNEWKEKGEVAAKQLSNLLEIKETFAKEHGIVLQNGQINLEQTARQKLKEQGIAATKENLVEAMHNNADIVEQYNNIENNLRSDLRKAQSKYDGYAAQYNNSRTGLAHSWARELGNGARAVKSGFYEWRKDSLEKQRDALKAPVDKAINDSGSQKIAELKEFKKNAETDLTYKLKEFGIKLDDAKYRTGDGKNRVLNFEQIVSDLSAKKKGLKYTKDINKIDDAIARVNSTSQRYGSIMSELDNAEAAHGLDNRVNFYRANTPLHKAVVKAARAGRRQAIDELNRAQKSGRVDKAQEMAQISKIQGYDETIKQIGDIPPRYKSFKAISSAFGDFSEAFKEANAERKARKKEVVNMTYYKKGARAALKEGAAGRRTQIQARDAAAAAETEGKILNVKASKAAEASRLSDQAERDYINKVKKALMNTGYAGDLGKIVDTVGAKAAADSAIAQLAARRNSKAIDDAAKKVLTDSIRKLRSASLLKGELSNNVNIRREIEGETRRISQATLRKEYLEQFNKMARDNKLNLGGRGPKSGAGAYEMSRQLEKKLSDSNAELQRRIKKLESDTQKGIDSALNKSIASLKAQSHELSKQIESIKKLNDETLRKAQKTDKTVKSLDRVMKDMRRKSKYSINKMPSPNKPTGSNQV